VEKTLKNTSNNYKEVGGERVTLPQGIAASDPLSRDAIKEDGRFSRPQEVKDLATPIGGEATATQDLVEAVPVDRVKSFMEVQF
jgi:hypothetical protein